MAIESGEVPASPYSMCGFVVDFRTVSLEESRHFFVVPAPSGKMHIARNNEAWEVVVGFNPRVSGDEFGELEELCVEFQVADHGRWWFRQRFMSDL